MQAECRGSSDPGNVDGKTWHTMMAIMQTLKRAQGRMLLLLQLPMLVKHCREQPLDREGPVRGCAIVLRAGGLSDSAKGCGGWDIVFEPLVTPNSLN